MNKRERIELLWKFLLEKDFISTKKVLKWALSHNFNHMTIRRDLHFLEQLGYVIMSYGNIEIISSDFEIIHRNLKIDTSNDSKKKIANKVLNLIDNDDVLFVGNGTTCEKIISNINKKISVFFTNGLSSFFKAKKNNFILQKILIGGNYQSDSDSFTGQIASNAIEELNFSKTIITCNGIDNELNVCVRNIDEAHFYKKVLKKSKQVILVVDSSKFDHNSVVKIGSIKDFDMCIIDDEIDFEIYNKLKDSIQLI